MPSELVKKIKKLVSDKNINPNFIKEYKCNNEEFITLKEELNKRTNNKCFFFTKKENNILHVIAFININIKSLEKELKILDSLESKELGNLKQGRFDPKGISFI